MEAWGGGEGKRKFGTFGPPIGSHIATLLHLDSVADCSVVTLDPTSTFCLDDTHLLTYLLLLYLSVPSWRHRYFSPANLHRLRGYPILRRMILSPQLGLQPSLDTVRQVLAAAVTSPNPPNLVPVFASISAEFLTPSSIYLKISAKYVHDSLIDHMQWRRIGDG